MESKRILIREDLDHFTPIGLDWYYGLKELGHEVGLFNKDEALISAPTDIDLFIVLVKIENPLVQHYVKKLKKENPECKIIATTTLPLGPQENFFEYVDYWFECGEAFPKFKEWFAERSQSFLAVPGGTNLNSFYKIEIPDSEKVDFSFFYFNL